MTISKLFFQRRFWELTPLFLMVFALPFLHGGETELARIIFLVFPIFYLPILFWRKRKVGREFMLIFWAWLAFLGANLISTIFSASIALSAPQFMELVGVFIYFVFFYLVIDKKSDLRLIAYLIIFVGLILSLISLFFIAFPPPSSFPGMNLVYAKFGHNHLADWLIFVLPIVLVQFLAAKSRKRNLLWGILLVFFLMSFFLTFSRGAYLAFSLILLAIIWTYRPQLKKLLLLLPLVVMPVIFLIVSFIFSHVQLSSGAYSDKQIKNSWILRQVVKHPANEARFEYWFQAIEGFKLRPVKGNGPGTFRLTSTRFQRETATTSWFAHNFLLQTLSELGILGFASFVFLLNLMIYRLLHIRIQKKNRLDVALIFGAGGSFLQSLVNFNFDFLAIYLTFWIIVAAIFAVFKKNSRIKTPKVFFRGVVLLSIVMFIYAFLYILSSFYLMKAERAKDALDSFRSLEYQQKSLILFPFSQSGWLYLLNPENNQDLSEDLISKAAFFNREDSQVLELLATDPQLSIMYYLRVLNLNPLNFHVLQNYISQLDSERDHATINQTLMSFGIKYSFPLTSGVDRLMLSKYLKKTDWYLSKKDLDFLVQKKPSYPDRFWGTFYYLIGLNYLEDKKYVDAILFWKIAIMNAPEWSYFHIELTNLQAFLGHEREAQELLEDCLKHVFPYSHCKNYQKNVKSNGFVKPGLLESDIRAIEI